MVGVTVILDDKAGTLLRREEEPRRSLGAETGSRASWKAPGKRQRIQELLRIRRRNGRCQDEETRARRNARHVSGEEWTRAEKKVEITAAALVRGEKIN
ncbi:hypothetical protein NDU88_003334 [Pleurodeles waltl]|uniref:Uncharacterized protein n=1 Tax=Pleurodeles waltl TaxID=8319 RepID=A0AAV7T698_PLEWA|nr:hypothetical protein NDU88_003334 [Pleurodeles waltl]